MTTATQTKIEKANAEWERNGRSAKHWAFGETCGYRLEDIGIPSDRAKTAAATCRFEVIGSAAWEGRETENRPTMTGQGRTFRTRLQTYGHAPSDNFGRVTARSKWAQSDAVAGANDILGCFDLAMRDVLDHYGNVDPTDIMVLDLMDIVETLRPGIVAADSMMNDPDPRTHARGRQLANAL